MLEFILQLARESGQLLREMRRKKREISFKSSDIDLVTDADRASEKFISENIKSKFPDHLIYGEETSGQAEFPSSGKVWVFDPLDGTVNYAHGLPLYSVSIALVENSEPIAGAVYIPEIDELFWAERGKGAFLNGQPIAVSTTDSLKNALLATGFPYDKHSSPRDNLENFSNFIKRARGVRRMGVASIDLCFVASGRFDGFWEEKLSPWDIAAGTLIVSEAGGEISDFFGQPLHLLSDHIVASNGKIHSQMCRILEPYAEKHRLKSYAPPR